MLLKNVYILGVTARPEKIFVQNSGTENSANESSVSNDESEYLVPIGDGIQFESFICCKLLTYFDFLMEL